MLGAFKFRTLLAMIVAFVAFSLQTTVCYAEHAGIIPCHEQGNNPQTPADDGIKIHCCHFSSTAILLDTVAVCAADLPTDLSYHAFNRGVPEAPVREIDYPPQRLS